MNLFLLDQASRRAWRLGKQEEVRIYYIVYAGTSGHSKLRKLGNQSGAAAAFAGEPARGALIEHAGADKTTLARLAAFVDAQQSLTEEENEDEAEDLFSLRYSEEEAQQLKDAFARRAVEEREALKAGRQWLGGVIDTLPKRLPAFFAQEHRPSVWKEQPRRRFVVTPDTVDTMAVANLMGETIWHAPEAEVQAAPGNDAPTANPTTSSISSRGEEKQPRSIDQAKPTHVPQPKSRQAREGKAAASTASSGALKRLVFGNEEHIALVRRPRRSRKPASLKHPKRTSPVEVRTIAAVDEDSGIETAPQVLALSLWEIFEETPMGEWSSRIQIGEEIVIQPRLW